MNNFTEYIKFHDIETAKEYIAVLVRHDIPFELDDASMPFELVKSNDSLEDLFILKIKDEDKEKVGLIFDNELDNVIKNLPQEHYLYSFNDNEILDIIANQDEWSRTEVKLALKIADERKIDLSADSIKKAKNKPEDKKIIRVTIENASVWFWYFGIFSIINSILIRTPIEFHLPGLAMTEYVEMLFYNIYGIGNRFGFIACLGIALIFFLFADAGKKNKWVFMTGLFILVIDSILRIFTFRWFSVLFNFIALWYLTTALINTIKGEKNLLKNSDSANGDFLVNTAGGNGGKSGSY